MGVQKMSKNNNKNESLKLKNKNESSDQGFLSIFDAKEKNSGFSSKINFKPLTQGLGFKDTVSSGVYTEEIDGKINIERTDNFNMEADSGTLDINNGDGSHGDVHIDNETLKLKTSEVLRPIFFHSGHDGLIKKQTKKSRESLFANFIDVVLSFSGSIVLLALSIDYLGFKSITDMLNQSEQLLINFSVLLISFYLCYKILARLFYGKSLGEWACRLQLGDSKSQEKFYYPLQVMVREIFSLLLGVFFLPIISALFNKDIGYYVSGLHTYIEHKNN